jgi:hypothetical protein
MRETATLVNQVKVAKLFEKSNGYCIWDNPITVPEAIKKMKIPIKDKNKMEVSYIKQRVQGQILLYQKLQFKNMGRLLLCIKMAEGQLVQYLYSNDPALITNYLLRHKKMVERGFYNYLAHEHSSLADEKLSEIEKKMVKLEPMIEPTSVKRKK